MKRPPIPMYRVDQLWGGGQWAVTRNCPIVPCKCPILICFATVLELKLNEHKNTIQQIKRENEHKPLNYQLVKIKFVENQNDKLSFFQINYELELSLHSRENITIVVVS